MLSDAEKNLTEKIKSITLNMVRGMKRVLPSDPEDSSEDEVDVFSAVPDPEDLEFKLTSHVLMKNLKCTILYNDGDYEYEPHVCEFPVNDEGTIAILVGFVNYSALPQTPTEICRLKQKQKLRRFQRELLVVAYFDMYKETLELLRNMQHKISFYLSKPDRCLLFQNLDVQAWIANDESDGAAKLFLENINPDVRRRSRISLTHSDFNQLCRLYPTLVKEYQTLLKQRRSRIKKRR